MSGGGEIRIEWANLDRMFQAMTKIDDQAGEVDTYFNDHVCSKAGFDYDACVLKPIGDQLDVVGGWFTDARNYFTPRWQEVIATVEASARQIDQQDNQVDLDFSRYLGGADGTGPWAPQNFPPLTVEVEMFELNELGDDLAEPEQGERGEGHNPTWENVTDTYDGLRDTINDGIDKLNGTGFVSIDRLSEKSLDDWIVYPLSGNYLAIRANADACSKTQTGMNTWANNFSLVSGKVTTALKGEVELSLVAHINAYNLVMRAIGGVVGLGSTVFNQIANVSEQIAIRVENALVTMARILLRVSTKIASRVLGWFGWAMLVKDLATRGIDAVMDIVDDVRMCIEIITACFDLVDAITAWAEECAARLETFQEIKELMEQIPDIVGGGNLNDLPPLEIPALEQTLDDMGLDISFGSGGEAEDDLNNELDDLDDAYGPESETAEESEESSEEQEPDDDEMLMAPGPLGVPGESGSSSGVVA